MITWSLLQRFQDLECNFAILILNQPILCEPHLIKSLWDKAVVRAVVDGGSNRWLNFLQENKITDLKLPDFLSGDFDSLKPETREHFESLKIDFIHTPDQDETDFTKGLRCVKNFTNTKNLNIKLVIAVCENSGRFDQVMGNINTLLKSNELLQGIPVVILSSQSVTWVLRPGKHVIYVTEDFVKDQYSCGLIPFCGPAVVTTSGLKWNLENQTMEMGGLISTSNTYSAKEIHVSCNQNIVWTTQYCKINE